MNKDEIKKKYNDRITIKKGELKLVNDLNIKSKSIEEIKEELKKQLENLNAEIDFQNEKNNS